MFCMPSVHTNMLVWANRTVDQITDDSGSDSRGDRAKAAERMVPLFHGVFAVIVTVSNGCLG
jgi:hypothetical protein